jgi:hypothetical protein
MSTPVIGIYYDSFTSVGGSVDKSKKVTVEQIATKLANDVVNKVNTTYAFAPPLSLENDMSFQYYPSDIPQTADLHLSNKLITMVTPKPEHAGRTAERWNELNKENKALIQNNNEFKSGAGKPSSDGHTFMLMSKRTRNGWITSWGFYVAAKDYGGLAGYVNSAAGCVGGGDRQSEGTR